MAFVKKPQLTTAEFTAALREAGFAVDHGRIVDVSGKCPGFATMPRDPEEQALQREGYIAGLTSREFLNALRDGINGRIAVTYFEWAGPLDQKIVVPWRLIDGPDTASAVAKEIASAPYRRAPRTSIYGALEFAKPLFTTSGYRGLRRIIDVSGDGTNNTLPW
jgi:Protein of unknown function (DUF1194)